MLFLTETKREWTLGTCCQPWPYPNLCRGPNPGKEPLILLLPLPEISHVFFTYQTPTLPIKSSSNDPSQFRHREPLVLRPAEGVLNPCPLESLLWDSSGKAPAQCLAPATELTTGQWIHIQHVLTTVITAVVLIFILFPEFSWEKTHRLGIQETCVWSLGPPLSYCVTMGPGFNLSRTQFLCLLNGDNSVLLYRVNIFIKL